jgi:hypothetical protein
MKKILLSLYTILLTGSFIIYANGPVPTPTPPAAGPDAAAIKVYLPFVRANGNSATPTPKPTSTRTPTPTATPTSPPPPASDVYYLSPTGSNNNPGNTEDKPWATFNYAWQYLYPGDTLILLDGIYHDSLSPNVRGGQVGAPITIRSKNDGKAIIDGQGVRVPIYFNRWDGGYFSVEGIIAKNSSQSLYVIQSSHNVFRRVSGYNANTDHNSHVFEITGSYNLVEDCIASGSGRKMVLIFAGIDPEAQHNTIRRCFASYREWDGREFQVEWPWNENFEAYSSDYNTFENDIAYGYYANSGFSLLAQGTGDNCNSNKILGSIAIMGGRDFQNNIFSWGNIRPQTSVDTYVKNPDVAVHRSGFAIGHGGGEIRDNLLQDILSWGNAGIGLATFETPNLINTKVNRATIYGNGLGIPMGADGKGVDIFQFDISGLTFSNSRVDSIRSSGYPYTIFPSISGEGARLVNRYMDGVLKDGSDGTPAQPLWPWPMEQRIRDEMGISVTNLVAGIIPSQVSPISDTNRPFLTVSLPIEPFGNVKIGQTASKLITLKNTGTAALSVSSYQFETSGTGFSVTSGGTCPNPPINLSPGQSCTVKITFNPTNSQAQTNYIYFNSPNIGSNPSMPDVYVSGAGY